MFGRTQRGSVFRLAQSPPPVQTIAVWRRPVTSTPPADPVLTVLPQEMAPWPSLAT